MTIIGFDAAAKAQRSGEAIFERVGELLAAQGLAPFSRTHLEVLGAESCYGPHTQTMSTREVVLRLAACHTDKAALELLSREIAPAGTSWAPGTTGFGGRASVSPMIRQYAFLLDKARLSPQVLLDGEPVDIPQVPQAASGVTSACQDAPQVLATQEVTEPSLTAPLIRLAWARSGDKGNTSNIGIIARRPEWLALGGGGMASLRNDALGKGMGQILVTSQ